MNRLPAADSKKSLDLAIEARDSIPMIAQPYELYVERMDPTKNIARFYAMSIEATLFGDVCLTRRWGRIGAHGQAMQHHFNTEEDAVQLFLDLLRRKRVRGYGPQTGRQQHNRRARRTS
jgi:predicted DNA-binding WGR domain protein